MRLLHHPLPPTASACVSKSLEPGPFNPFPAWETTHLPPNTGPFLEATTSWWTAYSPFLWDDRRDLDLHVLVPVLAVERPGYVDRLLAEVLVWCGVGQLLLA
jgi:hypothetical protein